MLKFLSCISQTDQSFLFLSIQLIILKSSPLGHHHCLHRDGNSGLQHIHQDDLALCLLLFPEIIRDFLTFLCNNRLVDGLFDLLELCLPLSDDLDSEISLSVRFDVLISQYPLIFSSRSTAVSFFRATVRISSRNI